MMEHEQGEDVLKTVTEVSVTMTVKRITTVHLTKAGQRIPQIIRKSVEEEKPMTFTVYKSETKGTPQLFQDVQGQSHQADAISTIPIMQAVLSTNSGSDCASSNICSILTTSGSTDYNGDCCGNNHNVCPNKDQYSTNPNSSVNSLDDPLSTTATLTSDVQTAYVSDQIRLSKGKKCKSELFITESHSTEHNHDQEMVTDEVRARCEEQSNCGQNVVESSSSGKNTRLSNCFDSEQAQAVAKNEPERQAAWNIFSGGFNERSRYQTRNFPVIGDSLMVVSETLQVQHMPTFQQNINCPQCFEDLLVSVSNTRQAPCSVNSNATMAAAVSSRLLGPTGTSGNRIGDDLGSTRHRDNQEDKCDENNEEGNSESDKGNDSGDCELPKTTHKSKNRKFIKKHKGLKNPLSKTNLKIWRKLESKGQTTDSKCKLCDKQFSSKSNLYKHVIRVHGKTREHCCELCGKQFSFKFDLEEHMITHSLERSHLCQECGDTFKTGRSLRQHIQRCHQRVNKQNRFQCDECGDYLRSKNALKYHWERLHSREVDKGVANSVLQPSQSNMM